ncbi:MAG: bifunctional UDP-3-O-[3-hydroxymyristoyl] N-acetylglucosamine deacetylase/3-hydroxyacyl-ACP dehydratase [Bacteroidia bacterium]|nr:bifunctional UDP-3-O-[3-hydroxymyristoyl] N-acetylglucosamine deacetylase/3-hydroxyacyl-ACP dehydratase [Bacteroidia bacterium]
MYEKQHTIEKEISIAGVGLHTGETVNLTFKPAPENHGYVFKRIDLPGGPEVKALVEYVVDTSRGTTIADGEAKVHTVEHTLAALAGLQIDNVLIELDGPEPPVMDGSSLSFVKILKQAGLKEQKANREYFVVDTPIHFHENGHQVDLAALPLDDFRVTVMVDYNSPVLGSQHATLLGIEKFEDDFASSRTFCFLHELEQLVDAGLIRGGNLDNAIVVVDKAVNEAEIERLSSLFNVPKLEVAEEGILNNIELRHRNEPARHKLLDLVGDLALVGAPIKAQILAARPGHRANVEFARKIKSAIESKKLIKRYSSNTNQDFIFDVNAIAKILPHRYPFLLVDRITAFSENKIEGYKNVTFNEPFFQGHFPNNPVMPGVLQLEAMGQVGGILLLNTVPDPDKVWVYFLAMNDVRFKKPVVPGDTLHFKLELVSLRRNICKMQGQGFVNGKLVVQAELTAALVDREEQN